MHFVDLRYKGIRISKRWKHLLVWWFIDWFFLLLIGFVVVWFFRVWQATISDFRNYDFKEWGHLLLKASAFSLIVLLVSMLVLRKVWDYIADLQRLCRLVYNGQFYLINNIAPNDSLNKNINTPKREMVYFPRLYYRRRKGVMEVTIQLDGSKFHRMGNYHNLSGVLEDLYNVNMIDLREKKGFLTYCLVANSLKYRISIEDVKPSDYSIPLLNNLKWDISKISHALVVGGTGGGKTYFLNALVRGFIKMRAELFIADPKISSLSDYELVLPNVAIEAGDIIEMARQVSQLMEDRYVGIKSRDDYRSGRDFTFYNLPPIVFIIDEFVAFLLTLDKKSKDDFMAIISNIVLKGREAGVIVILATQRPDAKHLEGGIRDQLGLRVALGELKEAGYKMAFGDYDQSLSFDGIDGSGYVCFNGMTFIRKFYSPLVPDGYDFIDEAKKLLM